MTGPRDALLVRFTPPGGGEALTLECPPDLRFGHEVPGGHKAMSCTVTVPAGSAVPPQLAMCAQVQVVDRRTGRVVWAGSLTDPGEATGTGPLKFQVTAGGEQERLDGWREVYGLVDRSQGSWQPVGDFAGASSMVGDLTPYTSDLDLGDITLGDELSGAINLGDSYPPVAGYTGYLGYLKDPTKGPGAMLPIPLGGAGSGWTGMEEGVTAAGATTSGSSVDAGTITSAAGVTTRRRITGGLMMPVGYMGPTGAFWSLTQPAAYDPNVLARWTVGFRLQSAGAAARVIIWADSTLASNGYAVVAGMDGTAKLVQMDGGVETVLDSQTWTPTVGTSYSVMFMVGASTDQFGSTLLSSPYDVVHSAESLAVFLTDGVEQFITLGCNWPVGDYQIVNPLPGQASSWYLHDGSSWGVGALGTVAFDSFAIDGTRQPE